MKKQTAIAHFGSVVNLAKALGIGHSAVSQWGEEVPIRRAFEIERISDGALKADFNQVAQNAE